ncbi:MAG: DUF2971 domain-containing protein [Gemmatimonadetes bacterium]|nr:DUF2971 domain-containing protein [Gemmatimonadota bacterium]MYD63016.1 DUF2971 domain-containing protein [Gemmatimonadota bacterium]
MPVVNPEFLSHYTSFEVLQKIVEGGTMWATDLRYMNDAAEFRYAIELIESMLNDYPAIKPHTEKVIDIFFDKGESVSNDHSIYSISFSENEDLLSQWRAYCPESGGVSIAFEKTDLEALGSAGGCQLIKCIYDENKQEEILIGVLEKAKQTLDHGGTKTAVQKEIFNLILEFAPKMKHQSFAEEREWRLVTAPIGFYEDCVQYRIRKSTFIPYVPLCIMLENRLGFDHVTIGPNQSPELAWFSTRRLLEGQIRQKRLQPKEFWSFPVRESDTPFRAM